MQVRLCMLDGCDVVELLKGGTGRAAVVRSQSKVTGVVENNRNCHDMYPAGMYSTEGSW